MYSNTDLERLFIRYKMESVPAGESVESFCQCSQIPYNLFQK